MQNPESLQPSETEELNQLQNYNKQYINNEMAAETGNIQQTAFFFFLIWEEESWNRKWMKFTPSVWLKLPRSF